jgi:hypothetical protein
MFNGAMEICAQQQHTHFTNALQTAGVKGFLDENTQTQYIERGPVTYAARTADPTRFRAIRAINPRKFCILNPDIVAPDALRQAGFRQIMTPASVAEINLTTPFHPLQKWRNAQRKAKAGPLTSQHRPFDPRGDGWLFKADLAQQRTKKFRAMPHAIAMFWPAKDTLLCTALLENTPVAAMLFLCHGSAATYQIGWTNAEGRSHAAHNLLLAQAVEILSKRGLKRLDLGIVDTENAPALARFKIGTGAAIRPLGGTWAALPLWRA